MDETAGAPSCAWCSTVAPVSATSCPSCGAALAQRESLGDVPIPGVTSVDPALQSIANQPLRLRGPSPTQGVADGIVAAAIIGGPVGLAALGGVAAVAAAEYAGARRDHASGPERLADVGRISSVAQLAIDQLQRAPDEPADASADPWRDEPGRSEARPWAPRLDDTKTPRR